MDSRTASLTLVSTLEYRRLRARLARRTALAAGLGFFAVIGWAHIVMAFGSGEGWW